MEKKKNLYFNYVFNDQIYKFIIKQLVVVVSECTVRKYSQIFLSVFVRRRSESGP